MKHSFGQGKVKSKVKRFMMSVYKQGIYGHIIEHGKIVIIYT